MTQELGADHGADAVTTLAVGNNRRDKLFGPKRQRRRSIAERGLHGHTAKGAIRDTGCDGARQGDAVAEELGREAVVGPTVDVLGAPT